MRLDQALTFAQTNAPRFVDELKDLLRIPSVSTDPGHAADVRRAAVHRRGTPPDSYGECSPD